MKVYCTRERSTTVHSSADNQWRFCADGPCELLFRFDVFWRWINKKKSDESKRKGTCHLLVNPLLQLTLYHMYYTMLYCNSHGILAWAVTKSSMSGYRKWGSRSGHDDQSPRLGECGMTSPLMYARKCHYGTVRSMEIPEFFDSLGRSHVELRMDYHSHGRCQQSISIIIKTRSMWQQVEI